MMQESDKGWAGEERLAIGRALLSDHPRLRLVGELATATGKRRPNVARTVEALLEADLLVEEKPSQRRPGRGRQAEWAYRLTDSGKERLEETLAASTSPGALREGQQLVLAEAAGPHLADLLGVLADAEVASQLSWSALLDGDPQEYLIAFEGPEAVSAANEMVVVLSRVGIASRRVTVAQVSLGHEFLREAKRVTRAASQAAIRQATRNAAGG